LSERGVRPEGARVQVLQRRKDGRFDTGLEVVNDHQGQGVARQGLILGVVDPRKFGPRLDEDHQRADAPIKLKKRKFKIFIESDLMLCFKHIFNNK